MEIGTVPTAHGTPWTRNIGTYLSTATFPAYMYEDVNLMQNLTVDLFLQEL